jgi:hypothetical protein
MPTLTIGMPVYNGARYLGQSIESLIGQEWHDFELIISDNCSTDESADIADAYARRDPRIRVVRQSQNVGAAANFNAVFRLGSAPYFKWACADDCLLPGFLGNAIAELDAHPEAVACYGLTTLVDAEGRPIAEHRQGLDLRQADAGTRFEIARSYVGLLHVLQGVMRTSALATTRLMRAFPGSDEMLVAELSLRGTINEIHEPYLLRRMHAEAASAATTVAERQEHLDPRRKRRVYLRRWSRSFVNLQAVAEAPLPVPQRARLAAKVIRSMIGDRETLVSELWAASRQVLRRAASSSAVAPRRN